ncbi:peptidase S41 [Marinilactibacillus sp. 15R]|uniref:Carboxyl-terminal processing protease n=1 Tax=Marinilactibacillus piezotolerans TaxID=258723 RepID=A0A1I3UQH7_9LACT|nr:MULTISPECIES: S41 family peptidase [Marinilactibacillus]API89480.1 peptidase S41 [Marinilactibacillus sp. 15R]SFJ84111.1 carboxyl-terminal processing protease [Marinilactibacillus piezotolerans]
MEQEPNKQKHTKKVSLFVYITSLIIVLIVGVIGTLSFSRLIETTPENMTQESVQDDEASTNSQSTELNQVDELYSILLANYFEEVDPDTLIEGALEGMAGAIGDPYTAYLDASQSTSLQEDTQGEFEGIGAEVMKEGEFVRIVSPISGSPAEKAGLQANDKIAEIDGESVADLSLQEAVALIRGPKDSEVELLLQRSEEEFTVTITRDAIPVESVVYELDESDSSIGYIQITNFNRPTYEELVTAIKDLDDKGAEKFVFDVRGNPGGLLDIALQMSNIFVEDGKPLMQSEIRGEDPVVYTADSEQYGSFKFDGEAVLLIDGGSASASEILAGAMSESAGIPLIGQTTFGKGTIQNVAPLTGDGEVKYTTGKWLTANGEWINEKGISPDIEVAMPDYQTLLLINSEETYQSGDTSDEVKNLNAILKALGYEVDEASSQFNDQTVEAVKAFQNTKELDADGIVTGATSSALVEALRALIEENDTQYNEAIKYLQSK